MCYSVARVICFLLLAVFSSLLNHRQIEKYKCIWTNKHGQTLWIHRQRAARASLILSFGLKATATLASVWLVFVFDVCGFIPFAIHNYFNSTHLENSCRGMFLWIEHVFPQTATAAPRSSSARM